MTRFTVHSLAAAFLATVTIGALPAAAETQIPAGQTCGGLLCDMGVFGTKVTPNADGTPPTTAQVAAAEASDPHRLPCNDFLCRAFGGKTAAEMAPPAPAPVAEVAPEPAKPSKHARKAKHRHVAKAEADKAAEPASSK